MAEEVLPGLPIDLPPQRRQVISNGTLGMLTFVIAETMMFLGLISAFTLARATAEVWPPPGQPRLPVEATALTTLALLISGVFLYRAGRLYRHDPSKAYQPFMVSLVLGTLFVVFQGAEWVALLNQGLTIVSSQQGSFFYLVVGMHALHAVGALAFMWYCLRQLGERQLTASAFGAAQVFWFFVVGIWPVLYMRVYL